jgi:hypothetical protein
VALCFILPAVAWAQAPSNEALHQKILEMERKLDVAIDEAGKAKDEANQAREELTRLREAAAAASDTSADLPAAEREKGIGLGISVEALYMRPTRSGLDFVVADPDAGNLSGSEKAVEADRDWGFRLGMAYEFKSGAFVGLRATTLDASGDASVTEPSGGSLWGTWLHPDAVIDDDDVTAADASYDFEQDVFDLVVGKKLTVRRNVGLRIDAGLRYAEMKQAFDIHYEQGAVNTVDVYQDLDYSGWGPTVGMDADWEMGWGISLFGSVSGSLLMGDSDFSIREVDFNGATTELVNVESSDNSRVVPVVEMRAGIGYVYRLNSGYRFGFKAGYEWQNWFNAVTTMRFVDDVDGQLASRDTTDIGVDGFFLEGFFTF